MMTTTITTLGLCGTIEWDAFFAPFVTIAGDLPEEDGPAIAELALRVFHDGTVERAIWTQWRRQWGQA